MRELYASVGLLLCVVRVRTFTLTGLAAGAPRMDAAGGSRQPSVICARAPATSLRSAHFLLLPSERFRRRFVAKVLVLLHNALPTRWVAIVLGRTLCTLLAYSGVQRRT